MKPKDLKPVFTWETRRVMIQDRVWYFPDYLNDDTFSFSGWEGIFDNTHAINIEYCSGNGAWIVEKAQENPEKNWVAVEKKYERVRKIWSKIQNLDLQNLIVVCGEGFRWTQKYVPAESVSEVFVNFPDPWPKGRHAKHRIISPIFAEEMNRILKQNASILMVTDDNAYSEIMLDVFINSPGFAPSYSAPHYVTHLDNYGSSYFDSLWREKGKCIRYHRFEKRVQ